MGTLISSVRASIMAPWSSRTSSTAVPTQMVPPPHRPGWYISRGNDVYVPLIAADELPPHIQLHGVTKRMSRDELKRNGMERSSDFLGEIIGDGSTFTLINKVTPTPGVMKSHDLLSVGNTTHAYEKESPGLWNSSATQSLPGLLEKQIPVSTDFIHRSDQLVSLGEVAPRCFPLTSRQSQAHSPTPLRSVHQVTSTCRPLPPSGREPDASKKIYCTHWIRTGQCDYTQQGCLYKHEIPDPETLASIGITKTPQWWQEHLAAQRNSPNSFVPSVSSSVKIPLTPWQHGLQIPPSTGDEVEDSDTDDLPPGNPETQRWMRKQLHVGQHRLKKKRPERLPIGMARPPPFVPVCGKNPKAMETTGSTVSGVSGPLHDYRKGSVTSSRSNVASTGLANLITLDMPPLTPSPPAAQSKDSIDAKAPPTAVAEPASGISPTTPSFAENSATISRPQNPKGRVNAKSGIAQQAEKIYGTKLATAGTQSKAGLAASRHALTPGSVSNGARGVSAGSPGQGKKRMHRGRRNAVSGSGGRAE